MISNVISKNDLRQLGKRTLLAALLLLALIALGLLLNAVSASRAEKNFELAADFPRGALVYAQFRDLPALLKQMNESHGDPQLAAGRQTRGPPAGAGLIDSTFSSVR